MQITFNLNYTSIYGQQLYLCGSHLQLGNYNQQQAVALTYVNNNLWTATQNIDLVIGNTLHFNFFVQNQDGTQLYCANKHTITITVTKNIIVYTTWCSQSLAYTTLFTKAFTQVYYPKNAVKITSKKTNNCYISVQAPQLQAHQTVCIVGSNNVLGNWEVTNPTLLQYNGTHYVGGITLKVSDANITYKYGVYNTLTNVFETYETTDNRSLKLSNPTKNITYIKDTIVNLNYHPWKGAGVAIPVFSLKSNASFGIGEFTDIPQLAVWCQQVGIKLIQLLPINDTIINKTNADSYPYAANSSFALHPMYINLHKVGKLPASNALQKVYTKSQKALNAEPTLNYEAVINYKLNYLKALFEADSSLLTTTAYENFYTQNKYWLQPYAAYCYLRDKHKTTNFANWGKYEKITPTTLNKITATTTKHYPQIAYWYYVQYHLHLQLTNAVLQVHAKGIALKGDIPIGVGRTSADAWQYPHLFNMDEQAGAPPDDFAVKGQNWGFPTYNWLAMQADNYSWWRNRFMQLSNYFDAFRIDHILGFFRIWSIPNHAVEGILGHFEPSLPLHLHELLQVGIPYYYERYCKPYLPVQYLQMHFSEVEIKTYFSQENNNNYTLQKNYNTQQKVKALNLAAHTQQALYDCISNVILYKNDKQENTFHINIAMQKTYSYQQLNQHEQYQLQRLYTNYYYERQNDFWRTQVLQKIPALQHSTNMLVCGEDLGMVPDCVPGVMHQQSILSLEVQRMPKAVNTAFVNLSQVPYLSVATPSTHDMSTIRQWWEENPNTTQQYYNQQLGLQGAAPQYCEPWVAKHIILQHLYANSILAVFQLQDLMAIHKTTRSINPNTDRINQPDNPNHYWCYRTHITLHDLLENKPFNTALKDMLTSAGRI